MLSLKGTFTHAHVREAQMSQFQEISEFSPITPLGVLTGVFSSRLTIGYMRTHHKTSSKPSNSLEDDDVAYRFSLAPNMCSTFLGGFKDKIDDYSITIGV